MADPAWVTRWLQDPDDELLYTSLSDASPQAQEWWDSLYMPLSHPTPRTGPRVFWPSYDRYLEGRESAQEGRRDAHVD